MISQSSRKAAVKDTRDHDATNTRYDTIPRSRTLIVRGASPQIGPCVGFHPNWTRQRNNPPSHHLFDYYRFERKVSTRLRCLPLPILAKQRCALLLREEAWNSFGGPPRQNAHAHSLTLVPFMP